MQGRRDRTQKKNRGGYFWLILMVVILKKSNDRSRGLMGRYGKEISKNVFLTVCNRKQMDYTSKVLKKSCCGLEVIIFTKKDVFF